MLGMIFSDCQRTESTLAILRDNDAEDLVFGSQTIHCYIQVSIFFITCENH